MVARQGAFVTGLDFSAPAIAAARALATEFELKDKANFVVSNVYDSENAVTGAGTFDLVFVSWGALIWLYDIRAWGSIVAHFLKPGGRLYLAEAHPVANLLHQAADPSNHLRFDVPYFGLGPFKLDQPADYADENRPHYPQNNLCLHLYARGYR